jgi:hypothetical protein
LMSLLLAAVLSSAGWEPLALARIGERFSLEGAVDPEGYDGQFVYFIARDPRPSAVAPLLDVPAYRYQRILLPLTARLLVLGNGAWIPWALPIIGLIAHAGGTWFVSRLLEGWGVSRWYALVYGLWVGFALALRLDLPETLAYGLAAGGIYFNLTGRKPLGWLLYGLAVFAKEVTLVFVAAQALHALRRKAWRELVGLGMGSLVPFMLFQLWLWSVFGRPGIGSGGDFATPFEWLPFMGIFRIGPYSQLLLIATLVVFAPGVILPAIWGLYISLRDLISGKIDLIGFVLLLNAVLIPFVPFSTYREPGGLLRFACGLVLSVLLFAGKRGMRRVLNYSLFWLVFNVFLLK